MLALHYALQEGFTIQTLLVIMDETGNRSRSHGLTPELIGAQAAALGLPVKMVAAAWENYEYAFIKCLQEFAEAGITTGIFGDIDLQHHREWEENVCAKAGLRAHLPLWGQAREKLAQSFIGLGYKAIVTCVNGNFLDAGFVGRSYDAQFLQDLPPNVDACGENGEFHTFVTAGPAFKQALTIEVAKVYSRAAFSDAGNQQYHYAHLILK